MKIKVIVCGVALALAGSSPLGALGRTYEAVQEPPQQGGRGGAIRMRQALTTEAEKVRIEAAQPTPVFSGAVRVPMEARVVKGAPYSAEVVTESVQVLADGNRIVRKTTGRVYRDSQGRTRREYDREPGSVATVSVSDPVSGQSFSLNPESKTAFKSAFRTGGMPPSPPPSRVILIPGSVATAPIAADPADLERRREVESEMRKVVEARAASAGGHVGAVVLPSTAPPMKMRTGGPAWEEKTEKLAARNIEGVMAEGTRTTRTIPAGAIGNDQPIVSVTEEWRSPELQVLVMTRTSDPRTGESTYKLQNITRAEPNQSWFEVPADYTVRESGIRRAPL